LNLTEQDSVEKIIHLLKAFSQFKKWQKSSMKLLIMCDGNLKNNNELNDKINSYKYKEDVQLLFELNREKLIQLLSAAYGFIYFSSEESAVLPVLIAMQSEAPVITNVQLFNEETASESAFFLKDNSIEALGKAMIGLYKAESLRAILIKQGLAQTAQFSYKDVLEKIKLLLN
jgi:glycosyltransferase involved in cell wall biosynthesis